MTLPLELKNPDISSLKYLEDSFPILVFQKSFHQFKVINMESWQSTSNLKGFDGLDYSLQSILDRIEDNSRSESVSVVKDLLDCRSLDEIDVMVDRVLAMAHVKDDIPVEENKDVPDMEFINSLNTDQLNHYINHFAQDDKSLKYAKKRLKKMNISKQKTTSRENRKPKESGRIEQYEVYRTT